MRDWFYGLGRGAGCRGGGRVAPPDFCPPLHPGTAFSGHLTTREHRERSEARWASYYYKRHWQWDRRAATSKRCQREARGRSTYLTPPGEGVALGMAFVVVTHAPSALWCIWDQMAPGLRHLRWCRCALPSRGGWMWAGLPGHRASLLSQAGGDA